MLEGMVRPPVQPPPVVAVIPLVASNVTSATTASRAVSETDSVTPPSAKAILGKEPSRVPGPAPPTILS